MRSVSPPSEAQCSQGILRQRDSPAHGDRDDEGSARRFLRCAYHANAMKTFDPTSSAVALRSGDMKSRELVCDERPQAII